MFGDKESKFNLGDKVVITDNLLNRVRELRFREDEAEELIGHYGMIVSIWHELDEETDEVAYNVLMEEDVLNGNRLTFCLTEDCLALETEDTSAPNTNVSENNILFRDLAEILEFTTTIVLLDEKGSKIGTLEVAEFDSPLSQDLVNLLSYRVVLEVRRGNGEYEIEVRLADV